MSGLFLTIIAQLAGTFRFESALFEDFHQNAAFETRNHEYLNGLSQSRKRFGLGVALTDHVERTLSDKLRTFPMYASGNANGKFQA